MPKLLDIDKEPGAGLGGTDTGTPKAGWRRRSSALGSYFFADCSTSASPMALAMAPTLIASSLFFATEVRGPNK